MKEIGEYGFGQFLIFLDAESQLEADTRVATITDFSVVVGSLFAKDNPAAEQIGLLTDVHAGVKEWQQTVTSKSESGGRMNFPQPSHS